MSKWFEFMHVVWMAGCFFLLAAIAGDLHHMANSLAVMASPPTVSTHWEKP